MRPRQNTPRRHAAQPAARRAPAARPQATRPAGLVKAAIVVALAIGVMAAVGLSSALSRCAATGEGASGGSGTPAFVSRYDWSGLTWDGGRPAYAEQGQAKSQVGIDASDHQGAIDWNAVARDGIQFAFVRAGSRGYTAGGLIEDERFAANVDGATAAGLQVGVYFFSQAVTEDEAREEADLVLRLLAGRHVALPVVFDHERIEGEQGRADGIGTEALTACARAFCERLEQGGYGTALYGNAHDLARLDLDQLGGRPLWLAEYGVRVPNAQMDFAVWQYTDRGRVSGVEGPVDMNLRFTDAL